MDDCYCRTSYYVDEKDKEMKTQDLIDKINEINSIARDTEGINEYSADNIRQIEQICETVLINWQCEDRYTVKDAIKELNHLYSMGDPRVDRAIEVVYQLESGVRNNE